MSKTNFNAEAHFSTLRIPSQNTMEIYAWFRGDPFEIPDDEVRFDALQDLGMDADLADPSPALRNLLLADHAVRYAAIGHNVLMFGCDAPGWLKSLRRIERFLPFGHSVVATVKDEDGKITQTINAQERVQNVRQAEGLFSQRGPVLMPQDFWLISKIQESIPSENSDISIKIIRQPEVELDRVQSI